METVYLETTFISYLASEPSRDLIVAGHQQITREWWAKRRAFFACSVSQEVLDEAGKGDAAQVSQRMTIVRGLPKLPINSLVTNLASEIVRAGALPPKAASDAVHIAVAAVAGVDYLLTWNCRHMANGEILRRIEKIVVARGFKMPYVCTPEELMGEDLNE
ncbi:MAG: type II toxin-antitoxin system VapC family toxin [Verrucomicrobia bacterium]|nr:type II toxin-antitoxin system VapC family toxin [Verrucomicrobiota bacterium]